MTKKSILTSELLTISKLVVKEKSVYDINRSSWREIGKVVYNINHFPFNDKLNSSAPVELRPDDAHILGPFGVHLYSLRQNKLYLQEN